MASPINNYQASALAARLAATYLANQGNVTAPANSGDAKPATDSKGASGGATSDGGDGVILSLSDEAKQLLASLQQGLQPGSQLSGQPTSLAEFLNSNGQDDNQQNDLLSAYSGALRQFQQWLSQPPQPKATESQSDSAPAKTATDDKSTSSASSTDTAGAASDSGTSGSETAGSDTGGSGVAS